MTTAGLDIGSVATKVVLLCNGVVVARAVVPTGAEPARAAETAVAAALKEAAFIGSPVIRVVATGYGRRLVSFANDIVTEITAGARGAYHIGTPSGCPRLLVDLGGQDTKAILLDPDGSVRDFVMNDKCAAGTGRFLEVMAGLLGVPLDSLGDLSARAAAPAHINSTCTVFAESEVISLVARGTPREDIIAGLHAAIASRIAQMVRLLTGSPGGGREGIFFAGGGALNSGVSAALRTALGCEVYVPPHPQYVVAEGAALTPPRR